VRSDIFIVHGRDEGRKETVARFVQDVSRRRPVILHEQVSGSDTIIEKSERAASTAAFAVVIATEDDVGRLASDDQDRPRARQNVILELGYFFGLLGRRNVALLFEPEVERPSDTDGILHIPLDAGSQWRITLTNELENAGFEVDRSALR
jgi:predicted nucleotide-binding protein